MPPLNNSHDLDQLMGRLDAETAIPQLNALEPQVWQKIAKRDARGGLASQPQWRATAVSLALALGAAFGGAATAGAQAAPEMEVFSSQAALAPSTILEGR